MNYGKIKHVLNHQPDMVYSWRKKTSINVGIIYKWSIVQQIYGRV